MAGSYSFTRISEAELDTVNIEQFDIVGAIAREQEIKTVGDEPEIASYVEVKPDRRLVPSVSRGSPGTDMTPRILLVEVTDPDDPAVIQAFKDRIGEHQS